VARTATVLHFPYTDRGIARADRFHAEHPKPMHAPIPAWKCAILHTFSTPAMQFWNCQVASLCRHALPTQKRVAFCSEPAITQMETREGSRVLHGNLVRTKLERDD